MRRPRPWQEMRSTTSSSQASLAKRPKDTYVMVRRSSLFCSSDALEATGDATVLGAEGEMVLENSL